MKRFYNSARLLWLAAALLAAVAGAYPAVAFAQGAPIDFDLKTLDGRPARLETFHGKPLVLHFFASWCDPCRDEMPLINTLAVEAGGRGFSVLGVAVQDTRASVTEFAQELGIAFPIALDLNDRTHRAYRIFGPPSTVFIDAQGVVRETIFGPMTPERARAGLEKAGLTGGKK